jgi:hypothetical protein
MVVVHMVWIKTMDGVSKEKVEAIIEATKELEKIPGVQTVEAGENVAALGSYHQDSTLLNGPPTT